MSDVNNIYCYLGLASILIVFLGLMYVYWTVVYALIKNHDRFKKVTLVIALIAVVNLALKTWGQIPVVTRDIVIAAHSNLKR